MPAKDETQSATSRKTAKRVRGRRSHGRPLLRVGATSLMVSVALVALGANGVAPWVGFGSQFGGVGLIGLLGAAMAAISLLGTVLRLQWRPLTAATATFVLLACITVVAVFPPRWVLALFHDPAGPIFYFETEQPFVALTIDDGLDPRTTPMILDALAEHDAHATFFVLSETLDENRELVARVLDAGHELANHQTTDEPLISLPPAEATDAIVRADAAIREFAEPKWFRPGGGIATDNAIAVARRLGCKCVLGSAFPFDSHIAWPAFLAAYVGERPTPGDVIVLHDGGERGVRTAEVLRQALPRLAGRGLRCETLSTLDES